MLSRRNVRIKVLQVIYGGNIIHDAPERYLSNYLKSINQSLEVLAFHLQVFKKVLRFSMTDAENRKHKMLPSEEDLAFTPILNNNELSEMLAKSSALEIFARKFHTDTKIEQDLIKKLYFDFAKDPTYVSYYMNPDVTIDDHVSMFLFVYKSILKNVLFIEALEDHFNSWDDDESLIIGAMKKIIKSLTKDHLDFFKDYLPDDETVKEFGETLLNETVRNDKMLVELINPFLENWDMERVAAIDLIMLKMAVIEILKLESIPTKVTLNEYVEISKLYSTDKSKEFVNGVLDRIITKLNKENKIIKTGRGLLE